MGKSLNEKLSDAYRSIYEPDEPKVDEAIKVVDRSASIYRLELAIENNDALWPALFKIRDQVKAVGRSTPELKQAANKVSKELTSVVNSLGTFLQRSHKLKDKLERSSGK